ncbi:hypothetical protein [Desulfospira joergensenii]|uniref:hypothetical protein n=1 Tax=Desulfospira joergensenii TaxID=53329 RepID=UPI0003B496CF|nr:hypothetical protein [Desulfospira joergensenii]
MTGQEALVYNDDDWDYMAASDADRIGWVYGDSEVTAVFEPEDTTAFDFKTNQLTASYEFMSLRSHGWTGGHMK